jgi:hypothetical protein
MCLSIKRTQHIKRVSPRKFWKVVLFCSELWSTGWTQLLRPCWISSCIASPDQSGPLEIEGMEDRMDDFSVSVWAELVLASTCLSRLYIHKSWYVIYIIYTYHYILWYHCKSYVYLQFETWRASSTNTGNQEYWEHWEPWVPVGVDIHMLWDLHIHQGGKQRTVHCCGMLDDASGPREKQKLTVGFRQ